MPITREDRDQPAGCSRPSRWESVRAAAATALTCAEESPTPPQHRPGIARRWSYPGGLHTVPAGVGTHDDRAHSTQRSCATRSAEATILSAVPQCCPTNRCSAGSSLSRLFLRPGRSPGSQRRAPSFLRFSGEVRRDDQILMDQFVDRRAAKAEQRLVDAAAQDLQPRSRWRRRRPPGARRGRRMASGANRAMALCPSFSGMAGLPQNTSRWPLRRPPPTGWRRSSARSPCPRPRRRARRRPHPPGRRPAHPSAR